MIEYRTLKRENKNTNSSGIWDTIVGVDFEKTNCKYPKTVAKLMAELLQSMLDMEPKKRILLVDGADNVVKRLQAIEEAINK